MWDGRTIAQATPLHVVVTTVDTDASGFATVAHGAPWTPSAVIGQLARDTGALWFDIAVGPITATTVRIRVAQGATIAASQTGIPIFLLCLP